MRGLGVVLLHRPPSGRDQAAPGLRVVALEVLDPEVHVVEAGEVAAVAVGAHRVGHLRDPLASSHDDAEAVGEARRDLARGGAGRDDRHLPRDLARVVERGVVEAADDEGVESLARRRPHRPDDAPRHDRLVGAVLDVGEAPVGIRQAGDVDLGAGQLVGARHVGEDRIVVRGADRAVVHDPDVRRCGHVRFPPSPAVPIRPALRGAPVLAGRPRPCGAPPSSRGAPARRAGSTPWLPRLLRLPRPRRPPAPAPG